MPRFVVLRQEMPPGEKRPTHWDFMLERSGVLCTWALSDEPTPEVRLSAPRLADHRLAYLEYEGEISGGRGQVTRWDAGHYELMESQDPPGTPNDGEAEKLRLRMSGEKITGEVLLTRRNDAADQYWFLWKGS